ncbi:MAG: exodeoxyribonuclease VII large subunit [Bacillota bacterium]
MKTLTVLELTKRIKDLLENDSVLSNLWVKGEISNFKQAGSGHIYFTLKDSESCIRAVMFRSRAYKMKFIPENGMFVRIRGYVSVYDRDGSYQLYCEEIEPDGVGALYIAFEQLKEKLHREGLFDPARKKRIPALPECIGIVTSPTGAAVRDMLEIISRRWPGTKIVLAPVTVQGDNAPFEIALGIKRLNALGEVDVIVVGRGGGSIEELWAFNTENVARAVYESKIPVISAVGHETDYTIADMVADLRAPTPSAAAELVVPVKAEVAYNLQSMKTRMSRAVRELVMNDRRRLENCVSSKAFRRPVDTICGTWAVECDILLKGLTRSLQSYISGEKKAFAVLAGRLSALSPLATMARGYSVCSDEVSGNIIKSSNEISIGDNLNIRLYKGILKCSVKNVIHEQ